MKRITALVCFSSLFWSCYLVKPLKAQTSCQAMVDAVAKEIRKKGTKVDVSVYPTGDFFQYPRDLDDDNRVRIGTIIFSLGGVRDSNRGHSVANNILSSKVLMKNYSSRIFTNCKGTAYVWFSLQSTDFTEKFGMTDDGELGVEKCSDYSEDINNLISNWGLVYNEYSMAGSAYCAYVIPNF